MKNKIYLMLLISALIASCSKDSSDDSEIDNPSNDETFKYLKKVTYTDFSYGVQNIDFSYQDGLLIKENDGGELVYFEYNSDKKIIKVKECSDSNLTNINTDNYNCTAFYPSGLYTYTNGKLSGYNNSQNEKVASFSLDQNGNLISDIPLSQDSESIYYTYDNNGNVLTKKVKYGSSENIYTFVWDGKKNPFNVFWKKYSYYDWGGQSIKPYNSVSCINKQNATKVFYNNVLKMETNYTYDTDGYPTSCAFTEYLSGGGTRQGTVTFTYN